MRWWNVRWRRRSSRSGHTWWTRRCWRTARRSRCCGGGTWKGPTTPRDGTRLGSASPMSARCGGPRTRAPRIPLRELPPAPPRPTAVKTLTERVRGTATAHLGVRAGGRPTDPTPTAPPGWSPNGSIAGCRSAAHGARSGTQGGTSRRKRPSSMPSTTETSCPWSGSLPPTGCGRRRLPCQTWRRGLSDTFCGPTARGRRPSSSGPP
mmetsp:Transcript_10919/g.32665  ORF Transcript_10919/g.32665 Transcript_10919/m.32665 type:complete len:207 (+) Transcript_10919:970-1590(+)